MQQISRFVISHSSLADEGNGEIKQDTTKVMGKANESVSLPAAGGESGKHSEVVWQTEQLSLTQPGPVLESAARARTDASAWTHPSWWSSDGGPLTPVPAMPSASREESSRFQVDQGSPAMAGFPFTSTKLPAVWLASCVFGVFWCSFCVVLSVLCFLSTRGRGSQRVVAGEGRSWGSL